MHNKYLSFQCTKVLLFFETRKYLGKIFAFFSKNAYITQKEGVCNTPSPKHLEKCHFCVYLCTRFWF